MEKFTDEDNRQLKKYSSGLRIRRQNTIEFKNGRVVKAPFKVGNYNLNARQASKVLTEEMDSM